MNNIILIVVCSLLAGSANLTAKERRGAQLLITKTDGQQLNGELIAVKQTSLLLLDSQSGADVSVDIRETAVIKLVRKSKALTGAASGFVVGALVFLIAGSGLASEEGSGGAEIAGYAIAVGAVFAVPGALLGAIAGYDETYQIAGRSPQKINEILEELHRQARVPDAQ